MCDQRSKVNVPFFQELQRGLEISAVALGSTEGDFLLDEDVAGDNHVGFREKPNDNGRTLAPNPYSEKHSVLRRTEQALPADSSILGSSDAMTQLKHTAYKVPTNHRGYIEKLVYGY